MSEQCDGIVDGKDVVGTIEPRLHANAGTDVLDEKQRPSEITDPGELSSSDSGCDSGNSCEWSNKRHVDSSGSFSEYSYEGGKWTTTAVFGRDLVRRPSDEERVIDSGVEGSVVEMEEFPTVYVRTLVTGKEMRKEEDICTYGLFDEVVGEATDSSTDAAVVSGLSDENVYRGEKGFTELGASCDTLSCMLSDTLSCILKRLLVRYVGAM